MLWSQTHLPLRYGEALLESSRWHAAAPFYENLWRGHKYRRWQSGGRQVLDDAIIKSGNSWAAAGRWQSNNWAAKALIQ